MEVPVSAPTLTSEPVYIPSGPAEPQAVTGLCGVCPAGCGVKIHLENGRITRITPLKGHPQGICCPRGTHAPEIVYSPDRLLHPLKRVEPRGAGQFERASWDEALDTVAEKLKSIRDTHGPDSIGGLASAKVTNEENYLFQKFMRAVIGTNNVDHCARL